MRYLAHLVPQTFKCVSIRVKRRAAVTFTGYVYRLSLPANTPSLPSARCPCLVHPEVPAAPAARKNERKKTVCAMDNNIQRVALSSTLRSHRAGTCRRRSTGESRTTAGRQTFGPWESRSFSACSEDTLGKHPSQPLFGPCEWVLWKSEVTAVLRMKLLSAQRKRLFLLLSFISQAYVSRVYVWRLCLRDLCCLFIVRTAKDFFQGRRGRLLVRMYNIQACSVR